MARNSKSKQKVTNVRMVDPTAGMDSVKVDRMISAIKESESQIRVLCGDNIFQDNGTTPVQGVYGFDTVVASDDFTSISGQFLEYRIRAIKFDVYDVNPANVGGAMFSTFHQVYTTPAPTFNFSDVVDGPDSSAVPPGTGKQSYYWVAHGIKEMEFRSTKSLTTNDRLGGLRYYINSAASPGAKFQTVIHAAVDFRGRV